MERNRNSRISNLAEFLQGVPLEKAILQDALVENSGLAAIRKDDLDAVIKCGLEEILQLEELAWRHRRLNIPVTQEAAARTKAVIVISGPGTWYQARKEDRYKNKEWAAWMDHDRLVHGAWVMRRIAEASTGQRFRSPLGTVDEQVQAVRNIIAQHGPYFVYTGREDEREAVRSALNQKGAIIPPEKVHIIEEAVDNTVDQVKTLQLPPKLGMAAGDRIALIAHGPQLMRMGHMLEKYQPFPQGVQVQPFPLPIPDKGIPEYVEQEIRGLLYYTFIAANASPKPYPYVLE